MTASNLLAGFFKSAEILKNFLSVSKFSTISVMNDFTFPVRQTDGHKGQHGKILCVGGSEKFHGAPILAALGAERSGADLIFLALPEIHAVPARCAALNFIVEPFAENFLSKSVVPQILSRSEMVDSLVIGNGLGTRPESQQAVLEILQNIECPVVIDADGIFPQILHIPKKSDWIVTPHDREFERLFGFPPTEGNIRSCVEKFGITILKTGPVDLIAGSGGQFFRNKTGVPEMTVGGTGDALSGIVGGLIAQGILPFDAACTAAHWWGKTGEFLLQKQKTFTAEEMLAIFPEILCQK